MIITNKNGFTLIELSIVLVIIGLIVGGIVVGKEMIHNSQIKALIKQSSRFANSLNAFKLKYNALPGEFPAYQNYFPTLTGPYCPKTSNMGLTNMNDLIDGTYEIEAAYAQLQAAGLIEMGRPQILQDGTIQDHYDCFYNNMQQYAALNTAFNGIYAGITTGLNRNGLQFGIGNVPILTVAEAMALDLKMDDGIAGTGFLRGNRTSGPNYCTTWDYLNYETQYANVMTCNITIYGGL